STERRDSLGSARPRYSFHFAGQVAFFGCQELCRLFAMTLAASPSRPLDSPRGVCFFASDSVSRSVFLRRLEVNLFKHLIFLPSGACQNTPAVFHHVRVPAEIAGSFFWPQSPNVGVLADQIFYATCFAAPRLVFPGAADGGDVFEPRRFGGEFLHFIAVSKFPRTASALQAIQLMISWHRRIARLPILIKRPHIADKRRQTRHRRQQQVIRPPAA